MGVLMLQFFDWLLGRQPFSAYNLFDISPAKVIHRFWRTHKGGTTVAIYVPDCEEDKTLRLMLQHAITPSDVHDGKLVPTVQEHIKRRGGKRQTSLHLSLETATALHATLGKALKCAAAKEQQAHTRKLLVQTLWASLEIMHRVAPK